MRVYSYELSLRVPWTVAHGTSVTRTNVFVDLGDGYGEAPIVPYYPYDVATVVAWLQAVRPRLADWPVDAAPDALLSTLPAGPPPAVSALDIALHDRWARSQNLPLYRLVASGSEMPASSFTVSLPNDEPSYIRSLERLRAWPLLKLKLGSGDVARDLQLVDLARTYYGGRICVDANAGWELPEAVKMISELAERGVLFVEEPLRDATSRNYQTLQAQTGPDRPPILADESLQNESDLERLAPYIDGVNVKLAKTSGISGALRLIRSARNLNLKILIGCMVESSVGVTAAAHLAPLADFADLDGHLQLANDPFEGAQVENGLITLPEAAGLGVRPRHERLA